MEKRCLDCGSVSSQPDLLFSKNKKRKDGFQAYCRQCLYARQKKTKEKPQNDIQLPKTRDGYKTCSKCLTEKEINIDNFSKAASQKDGFHSYCKECQKEYWASYKIRNTTTINNRRREKYYLNRISEIKKAIEYQKSNKDKVKVYKIRHAKKRSAHIVERVIRWKSNNPIHYKMLRQFVRAENVDLNIENFIELFKTYQTNTNEYKCHYCDCRIPLSKTTIDHVIPISKGGRNEISNLVISCLSCNVKKGNKIL